MRRPGFLLLLLFGVVTNAVAQSAGTLLRAGDAASAADHHVEAIAAYEAAIVQRPALRGELTAKLGRQYLWAGKTRRAAGLLRDSLTGHPEDCDVRFDYALALSWSNELRDAHREYQQLEQRCPARRQQARLRAAQIDRWQDRQSAATALYRQVLAEGSEEERRDARVGLGFVELEKDYNRSASTVFSNEPRSASAVVYEGSALAAVRLGDPTAAGSIIRRAEAANAVSPDLADVREELQRRDHAAITPRMTISRDADGTSYRSTELGGPSTM